MHLIRTTKLLIQHNQWIHWIVYHHLFPIIFCVSSQPYRFDDRNMTKLSLSFLVSEIKAGRIWLKHLLFVRIAFNGHRNLMENGSLISQLTKVFERRCWLKLWLDVCGGNKCTKSASHHCRIRFQTTSNNYVRWRLTWKREHKKINFAIGNGRSISTPVEKRAHRVKYDIAFITDIDSAQNWSE